MIDLALIVIGLTLLIAGGEALVRGASGIALRANVSPAVIGLTIVAAGTSMPELVVSLQSALQGRPGIAIGNVVGSNIFNIAAILGLTALMRPLQIRGNTVRLEWPVMMLAALQFLLLTRDGRCDRFEGGFLLATMLAFFAYVVWLARNGATPVERDGLVEVVTRPVGPVGGASPLFDLAATLVGVGLLAAGSTLLVHGAVGVATALGVSETVIGLTIVAAGTSTPELVTSLVAAWRGRDDIAVGNVIGSNIFNILGIVGVTALVHPVEIPREVLARDVWWMIGASLLLFPLMKSGMRINRLEGALLFMGFILYMAVLLRGV